MHFKGRAGTEQNYDRYFDVYFAGQNYRYRYYYKYIYGQTPIGSTFLFHECDSFIVKCQHMHSTQEAYVGLKLISPK